LYASLQADVVNLLYASIRCKLAASPVQIARFLFIKNTIVTCRMHHEMLKVTLSHYAANAITVVLQ